MNEKLLEKNLLEYFVQILIIQCYFIPTVPYDLVNVHTYMLRITLLFFAIDLSSIIHMFQSCKFNRLLVQFSYTFYIFESVLSKRMPLSNLSTQFTVTYIVTNLQLGITTVYKK
jgi:hypothetical protein